MRDLLDEPETLLLCSVITRARAAEAPFTLEADACGPERDRAREELERFEVDLARTTEAMSVIEILRKYGDPDELAPARMDIEPGTGTESEAGQTRAQPPPVDDTVCKLDEADIELDTAECKLATSDERRRDETDTEALMEKIRALNLTCRIVDSRSCTQPELIEGEAEVTNREALLPLCTG